MCVLVPTQIAVQDSQSAKGWAPNLVTHAFVKCTPNLKANFHLSTHSLLIQALIAKDTTKPITAAKVICTVQAPKPASNAG